MLLGSLLLVGGIVLVLWGAERFTDGAIRTATRFGLSTFYVGALVSGFEPENLVTGVTASAARLPQIAQGTVIGSAIFLLTGGLGAALLLVPMGRAHPPRRDRRHGRDAPSVRGRRLERRRRQPERRRAARAAGRRRDVLALSALSRLPRRPEGRRRRAGAPVGRESRRPPLRRGRGDGRGRRARGPRRADPARHRQALADVPRHGGRRTGRE